MQGSMDGVDTSAAERPKKSKAKKRPKSAKKAKKKTVKRKPAKKAAKARKPAAVVERSERLDLRLTKAEKAKITAKADKTRRTITSLVVEAIEKIK